MAGDIDVKKSFFDSLTNTPPKEPDKIELTGYLLEDLALWAGHDRVPPGLKEYLGIPPEIRHPRYPILDEAEATKALAFCFHLHGLSVLERLRRAAKGQEPKAAPGDDEQPELENPLVKPRQKKNRKQVKKQS